LNYGKQGESAMRIGTLKGYWPVFGVTDQTPAEKGDQIGKEFSPIYGVVKTTPPTLIIHGEADTLVPIQQSELIMAKLEEAGVPHKLERRPGKGHGWPDILKDFEVLTQWIETYLAKK
jgi:dipeptidyl aminopeptidase/acylaminoacyl peptidase